MHVRQGSHLTTTIYNTTGNANLDNFILGSTLSLTCTLRGAINGPNSNLSWYHDDQPVSLETARNSLSLATERSEQFISSRFLLPRASATDGGNYTCRPSEALPVSVLVHVLSGKLRTTTESSRCSCKMVSFEYQI